MKIEQQLIRHGFKKFTNQLEKSSVGYIYSYQLRVDDDKGKKYFIDVDLYDYNLTPFVKTVPKSFLEDLRPQFYAQFNSKGETFNVEWLEKDVEGAIAFFERLWQSMRCDYYENWYGD